MICGSRLLMAPRGGGLKIHRPGEMAKLIDPRNVVALGRGRRGYLIRIWVKKLEAGAFNEDARAAHRQGRTPPSI
jgi:hypothetical protein